MEARYEFTRCVAVGLRFFSCKPICVELVDQNLSTDAGLLVFRQFDEKRGFKAGFTEQLDDPRDDPDHSMFEMVCNRVFGILAGYEDQNNHGVLRSDPVFKLLAGRSPDADDLASQTTLSRSENAITPRSLLEEWFIERFINSFDAPPGEITLDVDVLDDETHGSQQLTLFHGYYRQYQYLVCAITCAENDRFVRGPGTCRAGLTPEVSPRADSAAGRFWLLEAVGARTVRASGRRVFGRDRHEQRSETGKRRIPAASTRIVRTVG